MSAPARERRKEPRREEDRPKPVYMSRTVLCAWVGILASGASLAGFSMSCEEQDQLVTNLTPIITLASSFGAFLFRLMAKRRIG